MPHICERVIYFLQTDDEEWELKPEYRSPNCSFEDAPFTMSGSHRSHQSNGDSDMDGMDEFHDDSKHSLHQKEVNYYKESIEKAAAQRELEEKRYREEQEHKRYM